MQAQFVSKAFERFHGIGGTTTIDLEWTGQNSVEAMARRSGHLQTE